MSSSAPLRLGILGTGFIAREFAAALMGVEGVRMVAVASRQQSAADAFAGRVAIPHAYSGYSQLLADPEVEAVYIALPNSQHADWAVLAAEHGKHVLCEKPLAPTLAQVKRVFASAHRHGVLVLEAFPFHFQPQTLELCRRLSVGEIGALRTLYASIGFTVADPDNIRFKPELGGGALLDAGCYPVSLARLLIGARPVWVSAQSTWNDAGVDVTTVATLRYPEGQFAQISCSMSVGPHRIAVVAGSAGVVETPYSNHTEPDKPAVFRLKSGTGWDGRFDNIETTSGNGFRLEAEAFARMVRSSDPAKDYERISLDNAMTLEAIARSARSNQPVRAEHWAN